MDEIGQQLSDALIALLKQVALFDFVELVVLGDGEQLAQVIGSRLEQVEDALVLNVLLQCVLVEVGILGLGVGQCDCKRLEGLVGIARGLDFHLARVHTDIDRTVDGCQIARACDGVVPSKGVIRLVEVHELGELVLVRAEFGDRLDLFADGVIGDDGRVAGEKLPSIANQGRDKGCSKQARDEVVFKETEDVQCEYLSIECVEKRLQPKNHALFRIEFFLRKNPAIEQVFHFLECFNLSIEVLGAGYGCIVFRL